MSAAPVTERFGAFPHNCRGGQAPVPALFGAPFFQLAAHVCQDIAKLPERHCFTSIAGTTGLRGEG
jgi:hypothetical protein